MYKQTRIFDVFAKKVLNDWIVDGEASVGSVVHASSHLNGIATSLVSETSSSGPSEAMQEASTMSIEEVQD